MSNSTAPTAVRQAESEIATLLGACIDYQRTLAQLHIPDSVTGRIEALCQKYGVTLEPRSLYGETPRKVRV